MTTDAADLLGDTSRLALVALLNCRVAGMKAENDQRLHCGNSMAYVGDDFFAVEREFTTRLGLDLTAKPEQTS